MPGKPLDKKELLAWCQHAVGARVQIQNFSSSWNDGLAFCALLSHFFPEELPWEWVQLSTSARENQQRNLELAFGVARAHGAPAIFDVEDMLDSLPRAG